MGSWEFAPRIESRVYAYTELTRQQVEAATKIVAALKGLAAEPMSAATRSEDEGFLPFITASRRNNVLLIDGPRGQGKTTLLIALLDRWAAAIRDRAPRRDAGGEPAWDGTDEVWIVPFGLVDLHPLPEATVLLMHIVVRLGKVVQALDRARGARSSAPPWRSDAKTETVSVRDAWNDLLDAIASGWDPSGQRRLSGLDRVDYAQEIRDAELNRQDVHHLFSRFMDVLVAEYQRFYGHDARLGPMFVLGIDDADQIPRRAVELVNVLRMLVHPRIAFVLTGDSSLFERQMVTDHLGSLKSTWAQLENLGLAERYAADAAELARNLYDRTIPSPHRCVLGDLPRELRRNVRLERGQALGETLAPLTLRDGALSFHDALNALPWLEEMFPARLRALHDLQGMLREAARVQGDDPRSLIARSCVTLFEAALSSTTLPTEMREALEGHVSFHPGRGSLRVWFDRRVEVELDIGASSPRIVKPTDHGRLEFADGFDLLFYFRESPDDRSLIPPRAAAALCFALLVADLDERHRIEVDSDPPLRAEPSWLALHRLNRVDQGPDRRRAIPFGLLPAMTHVEYLLVALRWRVFATWCGLDLKKASVEDLFRHLFGACTACPPTRVEPRAPGGPAGSLPTLAAISDHVRGYLRRKELQQVELQLPRTATWIEQWLPLFVLPEYGLPTALATQAKEEFARIGLHADLGSLFEERRRRLGDAIGDAKDPRSALAVIDPLIAALDRNLPPGHPARALLAVSEVNAATPTFEAETFLWERFSTLGYSPQEIPHVRRALERDLVALRRFVSEVLAALPPGEGGVNEADDALRLWRAGCAATERPDLVESFFLVDGAPRFAPSIRDGALQHEAQRSASASRFGLGLTVAVRAYHTAAATIEHKRLPPILSALFYLFRRRFEGRGGPRFWYEHRVSGRVPGRRFTLPGPCPFVLGSHERQLDSAWEQLIADLDRRGAGLDGVGLNNEVALALVDMTRRVLSDERFDAWASPTGENALRVAVDALRELTVARGGELPALRPWLCNLATLGAPEWGLSNHAAEALLSLADDTMRDEILATRIERLSFDRGGSPAALAHQIDRSVPSEARHPWARRFRHQPAR